MMRTITFIRKYIPFFILFLAFILSAHTPGHGKTLPHLLSVNLENDVFAGTDRYYTNGFRIHLIRPYVEPDDDTPEASSPAAACFHHLPFMDEPDTEKQVILTIGQVMHTPNHIKWRKPNENDSPYSGWTYVYGGINGRNERRENAVGLAFGMVGPLSFAKETQSIIHELSFQVQAEGWSRQLKNEPGALLMISQKRRLLKTTSDGFLEGDVIGRLQGNLGNVRTGVDIGLEARFGSRLSDNFGSLISKPTGEFSPPAALATYTTRNRAFDWHVFVGAELNTVLYDIFLDGNTFANSADVDKEPFTAEFTAGVGFSYKQYRLTYAQVLQTRKFDDQENNHCFGTLTFSVIH